MRKSEATVGFGRSSSGVLRRDRRVVQQAVRGVFGSLFMILLVSTFESPVGASSIGNGANAASSLPAAVSADGTTWQTFVDDGLNALAKLDGSSSISLSDVQPVDTGSFTFSKGTYAGTTVTTASLAGTTTDSAGSGTTVFTLLNNTDGLVERLTNCQSNEVVTGSSTNASCVVTDFNLATYSDTSPASSSVTTAHFEATSVPVTGGGVSPDVTCAGYDPYAFFPENVGSDFGPLIEYGGFLDCNAEQSSLGLIDGLYNESDVGWIGTGYSHAESEDDVAILNNFWNYAPCYSPYTAFDFETAQLDFVDGSEQSAGQVDANYIDCAPISVAT